MLHSGASELVIAAPLARADLPGLYARVCRQLAHEAPAVAVCDLSAFAGKADAVTVDALARLQLAARRHGVALQVRGASSGLRDLVRVMGLSEVLPDA